MIGRHDRTALMAGFIFLILGALFLVERLGYIDVSGAYLWPLILIALGISVLAGGASRHRRRGWISRPESAMTDRKAQEEDEAP